MPDAYAARSFLAGQPFVAAARIRLIGWSHSGITTLHAVDDVYLSRFGNDRFRAAIAFYPGCLIRLLRLNAPLLILIGEEDDWTPAARCRRMEVEPETPHEFTLKVYPGAYHESTGGTGTRTSTSVTGSNGITRRPSTRSSACSDSSSVTSAPEVAVRVGADRR